MALDEASILLESQGLRFVVSDRRPHEAFPPDFYIIDQSPLGASQVKPNRKVYLTVATSERPTGTVPQGGQHQPETTPRIQLQNHGLRVGNITVEKLPLPKHCLASIYSGRYYR